MWKTHKAPKAIRSQAEALAAGADVAESSPRLREEARRRPSPAHLEAIGEIFEYEVNGYALPLRRIFVAGSEGMPPPLSWLLPRAGLDAVQLKTFLLVLCMAAYPRKGRSPLYAVPYDPDVYAKALDLPEVKPQSTKGARRVGDAVRRLERHSLITAKREGGAGPRTRLRPLREDGSGKRYSNPAGHEYPKRVRSEGDFIQVPHALLRNGWLSALSGAALTSWLVLREAADLNDPSSWIFVSPSLRTSRYHVSQDTYLRGLTELEAHGLVVRQDRKTHVGPGPFDWSRQENVKLLKDELERKPDRALIPGIPDAENAPGPPA